MRAHIKRCVFYWLHSLHPLFMGILSGYKSCYTTGYIFLNWLHLAAYLIGFGYCGQKLPCRAGLLPKSKGRKKKPLGFSLRGDSPLGVALAPQKLFKGLTLSQIQASREKSKLKGKVVKITIYISGECQ